MGNYLFSYDLNGKAPTHAQMDAHAAKIGARRILETVWYVHSPMTYEAVFEYIDRILSANDRLLVIDAKDVMMRNLLVTSETVQKLWRAAPPALPRPPVLGRPVGGILGR